MTPIINNAKSLFCMVVLKLSKTGRRAFQRFLLAHITTEHARNKVPHNTERILVCELAEVIVVPERVEVALMIIYQPFEDRRFVMNRKVTDLDHKDNTGQAIGVKADAAMLELVYTR
jgi:hypothetical protein